MPEDNRPFLKRFGVFVWEIMRFFGYLYLIVLLLNLLDCGHSTGCGGPADFGAGCGGGGMW